MALRTPPSWLQNASHPAENDRLSAQAIYATTGIIVPTSLAVTQNFPAGMSVLIAGGWGAIVGTTQANMGVYQFYNDATATATITTANPSNPRIDRVCITVNDAYYTGALNNVTINVVAGTAAASPVAPATPANSISLATIAVGAGVTSILTANITDTRVNVTTNLPVGDITDVQGGTGISVASSTGPIPIVSVDPTVPVGWTTTATAAGTTTLTAASNTTQFFTGTTTQTIVLPVTSTLVAGKNYVIHNNSTGALTVQSSGANTVVTIVSGNTYLLTCILTSGTTAASWDADFTGTTATTGSGSTVLDTNPSLTSPLINLGINANTATTYTFVLADNGKLVTSNNASTQTLSIPTNASVAYPIGAQINVTWITGAGQPTINAVTSGTTTVLSTGATSTAPKLRVANSVASCIKIATDTWLVTGDVA